MVLLALDADAPLPDRDDAGHHAESQSRGLELRALLDMHLQEAPVPAGLDLHPRLAGQPGRGERLAQRRAVVAAAAAVDLLLRELADDRPAAEEAALEVPLLVGEGGDIDRQ